MKRPAFQWYPGDFRRDTAVQACSFEARALWREMLDLMHDGEPRGHLTAGGMVITDEQLARIVGVPIAKVRQWIKELEQRKVFSRDAEGVIYSRRMVRDEHVSEVRKHAGKLGGNPNLVKQPDNQTGKQSTNHAANQTVEQNLTPAVAVAVADAVALSTPLDLDPENSMRRGSETAAAPPADATLDVLRAAFRVAFYADRPASRQHDVDRQILATLGDPGAHLGKGTYVRAGNEARLRRKLREVLSEGVKDPDKAIRVLLLKLADSGEASDQHAAATKREEREADEEQRHNLGHALAWLAEHPDVAASIEDAGDADTVAGIAQRFERNAKILGAWRAAGAPRTAGVGS